MHFAFSELLVVLIVALLVLRPERLPEVAEKLGRAWRIWQQFLAKCNADLIQQAELQHNQAKAAAAEKNTHE